MKAIIQHRYGGPERLELAEIERPEPAAGEVLVRVAAASVNAADWHVMRGDPLLARAQLGLRRPRALVRGRDFAGEVVAIGPSVSHVAPGDAVFGETGLGGGTFAEYVCAPATQTAAAPACIGLDEAAALPLAGCTALQALRDAADLSPGQRLLINGASGGVGTFAVQLGRALGAHVTGMCSSRNVELVRSLGADAVVDYTREDVATSGERYDVVLDLVGNRSLRDLRRLATERGTVVLSGGGVWDGGSVAGPLGLIARGALAGRFARQRLIVLTAQTTTERLTALAELVDAGRLRPVIDRTFALTGAADALRYVETEHARAKVMVTVLIPPR
ncbi:MAG: NAD(P)-dependent alcohol dehydrogenase [Angustibacter sp.]